MECTELFSIIDSLNEKYVKVFSDVCDIESYTPDKAGVDRCADYFVALAKELGFSVRKEKMVHSGDPVSIIMNENAKGKPVVFSGHIDTVHPTGCFGEPRVYFDADELHGPGACDCKGGCVAGLMAMEALLRYGFTSRPVKLILQTDEENSSLTSNKATVDFMEREAKGCRAFLNCEPATDGQVTIARKGIIRYILDIKGRAGHSSKCYDAVSAIAEAAHKIIELEKWKDADGITCNCGVIEGGTVANTVPEHCRLTVDIRFKTAEELLFVERRVREIAERSYVEGSSCTVTEKSRRVSMELCERNEALCRDINEIYSRCGLPEVKPVMRVAGSDAADMTSRGIPTLDGFGVGGGYIHSVREYAFVSSLAAAAKRMAAIAAFIED